MSIPSAEIKLQMTVCVPQQGLLYCSSEHGKRLGSNVAFPALL